MSETCYICGHDGLEWRGHFFHEFGPRDMMRVRLHYFEDEEGICDICHAMLTDVIFCSRHDELDGKTWGRLKRAWRGNLREREAEET